MSAWGGFDPGSAPAPREPGSMRRASWRESELGDFMDRIRVTRRRVLLRAERALCLPRFRGALWHSVVGAAVKRLVCTEPPGKCSPCVRPEACAYAALFEARARGSDGPFVPGAQVPNALWFDAGAWAADTVAAGQRFVVAYTVGGRTELAPLVDEAVGAAAAAGLGRARVAAVIEHVETWVGALSEAVPRGDVPGPGGLVLEFLTPLRLKRRGEYLRTFDPTVLARDLAFRLAALGHYHAGLPWPAPWNTALREAAVARVTRTETRWVEGVRYSARQQREIVMGGLLGRVRLEDVGPALAALLGAGTVIHAGKGASVGLGEYGLRSAVPEERGP